MANETVPASSKKLDGKVLTLTDNTVRNIKKKAFILDSEALLAQNGVNNLHGTDASDAVAAQGITPEQLEQTPDTYSNLALTAVEALQKNQSKEERIAAIASLTELGYTNIYASSGNSDYFILPAEKEVIEEMVEKAKAEETEPESPPGPTSNPLHGKGERIERSVERAEKEQRRQNSYIKEQNERIRQAQDMERQANSREAMMQKSQFIQPRNNNFLQTLMPNVGKSAVVNKLGRANPGIKSYTQPRPQAQVVQNQRPPMTAVQRAQPHLNPVAVQRLSMRPLGSGTGIKPSVKQNVRTTYGMGNVVRTNASALDKLSFRKKR